MNPRLVPLGLAISLVLAAPCALAQTVPWRAVIGTNSSVVVPGLPSVARSYGDVVLSDAGGGRVGVRMSSSNYAGYWAYKQGAWAQYMKEGVTGALGPGRSGGEAAHVFLDYSSGFGAAGFDGQRVFVAKAGNPADSVNATWGVWRWDQQKNVEIARVLTDGTLGPGMGLDWTYAAGVSFGVRAMSGGRALVNADVTSPTNQVNRLLVQSLPGAANQPCMLRNSTSRDLAPNLVAGDTFDTAWDFNALAVTPGNRVYGAFSASSGDGIWEVCNGAPRARAATGRTDALGPDIGVATAQFTSSFTTPRPGDEGNVYFFANFRPTSGDSSRAGLFWNDGASNRPLAMNDASGSWGPHWLDATWSSFDTSSLMSAGEWSAFTATVHTGDGGTPSGLWRVKAGGAPELVALFDLPGSYGPESGRTWSSFYARAVLSNGDIIVSAYTNPNNEYALWLLKRGTAPRRILAAGQSVSIPTSSGIVADTVNSFSFDASGPALYGAGVDSWAGADGSVLVEVNAATYGNVRVMAIPSNPVDLIFRNGYDG